MILEWYGGGPTLSVVGPPLEDTTRWVVHNLPGIALKDFDDVTSDSEESDESANHEVDGASSAIEYHEEVKQSSAIPIMPKSISAAELQRFGESDFDDSSGGNVVMSNSDSV